MLTAEERVFVTVSKDGPYIVSGNAPLTEQVIVANADGESLHWQEGEAYAAREKYALCRCGHSHIAPFCDGTHTKIGFDGTETAERTPYSAQATVFDGQFLRFSMPGICARTVGFATRTEKCGIRLRTQTTRKSARCSSARCMSAQLVDWSPSTRRRERTLRRLCQCRSA
jgi:CDGSH-type Zn-finger protein